MALSAGQGSSRHRRSGRALPYPPGRWTEARLVLGLFPNQSHSTHPGSLVGHVFDLTLWSLRQELGWPRGALSSPVPRGSCPRSTAWLSGLPNLTSCEFPPLAATPGLAHPLTVCEEDPSCHRILSSPQPREQVRLGMSLTF